RACAARRRCAMTRSPAPMMMTWAGSATSWGSASTMTSMPFWCVRRATVASRGTSSAPVNPKRLFNARLFVPFASSQPTPSRIGQLERVDDIVVEHALEREVVDRDERRGMRALHEPEVHGRERRRPIVAVHDVGLPCDRRFGGAEQRRDLRENAEAPRVVFPI